MAPPAPRGPALGAIGRFAGEPSPDELAAAFFFDRADRALIARRRRERNRLGFAVQLGTLRALGTFLEDPAQVPAGAVSFAAAQIGVADTTGLSAYARGETRWDHQAEICRAYGYRDFSEPAAQAGLAQWLSARAWLGAERQGALLLATVDWLRAEKVLLPGESVLVRVVAGAREEASRRAHALLASAAPTELHDRLLALLEVPTGARESELERLRRGSVAPTVAGLVAALERVREFRALAQGVGDLTALPPARLRALAADARLRRARDIERMAPERRLATLVAFAACGLERAQDDAIDHLDRVLGELILRVEAQGARERLASLRYLDAAGRELAAACRLVLDEGVADGIVREAIFARLGRARLQAALRLFEGLSRPAEDRHRELMLSRGPQVRRFLPLLLDTLTFAAAEGGEDVVRALEALRRLEGRRRVTRQDLPLELVRGPWRGLVATADGGVDRTAYALWALEHLREGLRRRDVYVTPSERWGDPRATLLSDTAWEAARTESCLSLGLPERPEPFLARLRGDLDGAYARARETLEGAGTALRLARGELSPERLDALPEPERLVALRARVAELLPQVELPELVLEVAARTGFAEGFRHAREPGARVEDLPTSVCAVLVAQACNVGPSPLVDPERPALTRARLSWVAQMYVRAETIAAANARIVAHHARLALARAWGGGEVASVDGTRFTVPTRTIHAGFNRRYFHRHRGVTALSTTTDQYSEIALTVVPGTQHEALYILDGLLDPQTPLRPREVMSDTAGYSDVVFGLFRLLGYQFSPRLADVGGARFWRMERSADYGALSQVARHQVDVALITEHWDDVLRVAASLAQGVTSASGLVRALRGRGRRTASLARALQSVGRVAKTVHLLHYCADAELRRRIQVQLNRGESRHALARAVFHGRRGELHQPYREGQEDQLGALGLVVNCILLWNTIYMQRALEHLRGEGVPVHDEDVARLSPLGHEHINLVGRYRLTLPATLRRGGYRALNTGRMAA